MYSTSKSPGRDSDRNFFYSQNNAVFVLVSVVLIVTQKDISQQ